MVQHRLIMGNKKERAMDLRGLIVAVGDELVVAHLVKAFVTVLVPREHHVDVVLVEDVFERRAHVQCESIAVRTWLRHWSVFDTCHNV